MPHQTYGENVAGCSVLARNLRLGLLLGRMNIDEFPFFVELLLGDFKGVVRSDIPQLWFLIYMVSLANLQANSTKPWPFFYSSRRQTYITVKDTVSKLRTALAQRACVFMPGRFPEFSRLTDLEAFRGWSS